MTVARAVTCAVIKLILEGIGWIVIVIQTGFWLGVSAYVGSAAARGWWAMWIEEVHR